MSSRRARATQRNPVNNNNNNKTKNTKQNKLKKIPKQRDLIVKATGCSAGGLGFDPQHLPGGSQPFAATALEGLLWCSDRSRCSKTFMQNTHAHKGIKLTFRNTFLCFCYLRQGIFGCPGSHAVDQAGLKLTKIHLFLLSALKIDLFIVCMCQRACAHAFV